MSEQPDYQIFVIETPKGIAVYSKQYGMKTLEFALYSKNSPLTVLETASFDNFEAAQLHMQPYQQEARLIRMPIDLHYIDDIVGRGSERVRQIIKAVYQLESAVLP